MYIGAMKIVVQLLYGSARSSVHTSGVFIAGGKVRIEKIEENIEYTRL